MLEHILFIAMLAVFPIWDHFEWRHLKTTTDPRDKMRYYWRILAVEWIVVGLLLLIRGPRQLFFLGDAGRLPWELSRIDALDLALGAVIGIVAGAVVVRLSPSVRARLVKPLARVMLLLPRTRNERLLFVAVCLTAGICEELLYRGFLIQYLADLPISLNLPAAVLISCVLYGLAHFGQGPSAMLGASLFGGLVAVLFLATGNLLLPIVLHTLAALRVLAIPAPSGMQPAGASHPLTS